MGDILRFVTAAENEPVIGFPIAPHIEFAAGDSPFPTANTCVNKLCLIIGPNMASEEKLFDIFDLAFANKYFGMS